MMQSRFHIFFLVLLISSVSVSAQFSREPFVKNELLVKLRPGTESGFFARTDFRQEEVLRDSAWTRVTLRPGLELKKAIDGLQLDPAVIAAQPNFYYYLDETPNDTHFASLWGMNKIAAPAAWDTATGNSDTIVAIIDTGIQYTHQDLAANMWTNPGEIPGNGTDDDSNGYVDDIYGYDFRFNDNDPNDEHGHGTHVAGTVGAVGNNGIGVVGVNWNVRMIAVKIYDSTGFGTTSAMLINAYNYVRGLRQLGNNVRVSNNSYGGCDEACGYDQATKDAIDALGNAGVLNVFAAGNDNSNNDTTPHFPSSYDSETILATASSTSTDARSGFSNFGFESVDLAAPGSGILSTVFNGSGYGTKSGTSMASPHVAGAAALLSSQYPSLSNVGLKTSLMNSADRLANWNGVVKTGGRLNIANAVANQGGCNIALDPESQRIFAEGGEYSISVSAGQDCVYEVSNGTASIATVTSPGIVTGPSTVTYAVGTHSGLPVGGNMQIGDKQFSVTQTGGELFPHRGFIDFGGDGITDLVSIENVNNQMVWQVSSPAIDFHFGLFDQDIPIPGHYDSDLINDFAVWRRSTGTFYVYRSIDASVRIVRFGLDGDNPLVTQDFDGDEINDFAVTRKLNGKLFWYVLRSSDGNVNIFQFGNDTDLPLRGDYDGDGKADPAVYRPQSGSPANTFFILRSSDQNLSVATFGNSETDQAVPNDFDGDGKTDIAVWRETTGVWHILRTGGGGYQAFQFGTAGDSPTPGDYDGDDRTDFSVWRPDSDGETGTHYQYSLSGGFSARAFNAGGMLIPSAILKTR
jgi:subtilisin family serine protease